MLLPLSGIRDILVSEERCTFCKNTGVGDHELVEVKPSAARLNTDCGTANGSAFQSLGYTEHRSCIFLLQFLYFAGISHYASKCFSLTGKTQN